MTVRIKGTDEVIGGLKRIQVNINSSGQQLKPVVTDIYNKVQERSPVDSGEFKADWDLDEKTNTGKYDYIAKITNSRPYALPIEIGSELGEKPWPSAGPKTIEYNGRIFSIQVVDGKDAGVVSPVLEEVGFEQLAETIGDNILKGV